MKCSTIKIMMLQNNLKTFLKVPINLTQYEEKFLIFKFNILLYELLVFVIYLFRFYF